MHLDYLLMHALPSSVNLKILSCISQYANGFKFCCLSSGGGLFYSILLNCILSLLYLVQDILYLLLCSLVMCVYLYMLQIWNS
jgi:hypothetical protein